MLDPTDHLSRTGRTILQLDPQGYRKLVPEGPGIAQARDVLESVRPADLVCAPVKDADEAAALHAALWLLHDFLDESHKIAQAIDTPTGSFWHAIMHRREGDFSNSKYWYARCADHPALRSIAAQAGDIVHHLPADKALLRVVMSGWNPGGFVDLVQSVHQSPDDPRHRAAVQLQQLEWRVLFEHGTRAAVGG